MPASLAVWASQPFSLSGTANGTGTVAMSTQMVSFDFQSSGESYKVLAGNLKHPRDGGSVSFDYSASLSHLDMSKLAGNYAVGAVWGPVTVSYAAEGPSAGSTNYSTLTCTIARMRVSGNSVSDQGGRLVNNLTFDIFSAAGTATPFTFTT